MRGSKPGNKNLDRQRVINHIAAEIWIVTVGLSALIRIRCARQQRVAAGLCRRDPVVFPAPPCVPVYWVEEITLYPRCAAVEADRDIGDIGVPRPCSTQDGVGAAGFNRLVHAWPSDLRLQFHLCERPTHGSPIAIIPIAIIGGLPVALKWPRCCDDGG